MTDRTEAQVVSNPLPDAPAPGQRDKLGLALAGGGFRASLFHVGVLRRLAQLDVLRRVEVLSTVSGGSIVGALYVLLLKLELEREPSGRLTRDAYCKLVDRVEELLVSGIRENLRTRLFANPFGMLKAMLGPRTLGNEMARLYEKYIYAEVVRELRDANVARELADNDPGSGERLDRPGAMPLRALCIRPGGRKIETGIDAYNENALTSGGSVITQIVINATTLNSGGRFLFSAVEVGDSYLGYARADEMEELIARKKLLEQARNPRRWVDEQQKLPVARATLTKWWADRSTDPAGVPEGWEDFYRNLSGIDRVVNADLGLLRQAKVAAWYVARDPKATDASRAFYWPRVGHALKLIDRGLAEQALAFDPNAPMARSLCEFIVEVYLLRNAEQFSHNVKKDWRRLTVADAVAASANFPPVFPPFMVLGIYDDMRVARLGLTDGGVYDNTGIRALIDEGCTSIIASDTGGPFKVQRYSATGHVGLIGRIPGIMMRALGELQRADVRQRRRFTSALNSANRAPGTPSNPAAAFGLENLAYFQIGSPPLVRSNWSLPADLLASIRTDLDGFGEIEIKALVAHGAEVADEYVGHYLGSTPGVAHYRSAEVPDRFTLADVGGLRGDGRRRELAVLRAGQHRFFRALRVGAPLSIAAVAIAIVAVIASMVTNVSIADVVRALTTAAGAVGGAIAGIPVAGPALADVFTFVPDNIGRAIAWLASTRWWAVVLIAIIIARMISTRLAKRSRKLRTTWKWFVGLRGNVLWLLWAAPLWIVLAMSTLSLLAVGLFYLPWLRRARLPNIARRS